ncbi:MAG: sensor histidine kinase, partial [Verrucomicrobiota bacterium]|nr:sensor histidine kinase [Verrucomicrobiota bacterium]
ANRELLLRAKTSAIGAISSHPFHGLKNTLTGLELAINGAEESTGHSDARRSTNRLKQMVQEILEVIQEEEFGISYELTGPELLSVLQEKLKGAATDAGVQLLAHSEGECDFSNRDGNLILLILENLVRNAMEVTPRGGAVQCRFIADSAKGGIFTVTDSGPGIPASRLEHLFEPGSSTKTGGSGLGLAISRQLARQLGGELELGYSHSRGTQFQLVVSKSSADAD